MKFPDIRHRLTSAVDTTTVVSPSTSTPSGRKNAPWLRPLAAPFGESPFDIAQFEPHIFSEPYAWNPPGALLGSDPRFGDAEALGKLTRPQEILRIARGFAVVLAAAVGAALGQKPRRKERQDAGNLMD